MSALVHDALLYEGAGAFAEQMLPFVREGLERGERVLAVTSPSNLSSLEAALGPEAEAVDRRDSAAWYGSPGRAFDAYRRYIEDAAGRRVRIVGEPPWPVNRGAAVEEWARYESMANAVLADAAAWIVCPYDAASLPDAILEHALHTHPALHDRGRRKLHDGFVEPEAYWARLDERAPFEPPSRARRLTPTADLAALRTAVAGEAAAAGVPERRLPDVVLAVHELASNALVHGGGAPTLRTWSEDGDFVCEVADEGPGLAEPFAGYRPPDPTRLRGRGIWAARQLCDLVQVRSGPSGTRVRARVRAAS